jgi:HAD superfamily hydrolase (TIGR01509 family)
VTSRTRGAILFDLDGTLVESERESAEAMVRALARHGVLCEQADRDYIIGRSWVDIYRNLCSRYSAITWSLAELIEHTAIEREQIFAQTGVPLLPGARSAVERLAARWPLAIVTGSSRREAGQALLSLGLTESFRCVIAAEDIQTSKPDPGGYLEAARRVGADISRCLVVEDSCAGITAGLAAGARVVAVRAGNFGSQDQSSAHTIIETLDELTVELVANLIEG